MSYHRKTIGNYTTMFYINEALAFESLIIIPKEKFPLALFTLATLYSVITIKRSNHAQQNYPSSSLLLLYTHNT